MPEHFEKWLRCNFAVADLGGLTIGHNYRNVHTSSEMLRGLRSRQLLLFYFSSRAHFTALAVNIAFQVQIHHQIAHESWCWKLLGMKIIRHRRKTKKKRKTTKDPHRVITGLGKRSTQFRSRRVLAIMMLPRYQPSSVSRFVSNMLIVIPFDPFRDDV